MVVVATGSKHNRNTGFIMVVMCLFIGGYCLYDGWINEEFQKENTKDGKPNVTLQVNRIWIPVIALVVAMYKGFSSVRITSKRIVADEDKIIINEKKTIPYGDITRIDKRFFEKEGYFDITYQQQGNIRNVKFTDRDYDHLGLLLDEVVHRSGATPATLEDESKKDK